MKVIMVVGVEGGQHSPPQSPFHSFSQTQVISSSRGRPFFFYHVLPPNFSLATPTPKPMSQRQLSPFLPSPPETVRLDFSKTPVCSVAQTLNAALVRALSGSPERPEWLRRQRPRSQTPRHGRDPSDVPMNGAVAKERLKRLHQRCVRPLGLPSVGEATTDV